MILKNSVAISALAVLTMACSGEATPDEETATPEVAAPEAAETEAPAKAMTIAEATKGPSNVTVWKTGDDDTTVYLMGTVHILNPEIEWKNDTITAAWDASPVAYFEADVLSPEAMNEVGALIPQYGLNAPGTTLSSYYTEEEIATLNEALSGLGITMEMLDPLRPWLAGVQAGNAAIMSTGGKAEAGIEMILAGEAAASGKELRYFETLKDQIEILAGGDDADQARLFLEGAEDLKNPEDFFARLIGAWYTGDDEGLAAVLNEAMEESPDIAEALLYNRNKNWADELDALIENEAGTFFVAVGAGHLVGEKSVQDYLEEHGHASSRVN